MFVFSGACIDAMRLEYRSDGDVKLAGLVSLGLNEYELKNNYFLLFVLLIDCKIFFFSIVSS